tara:strand:- start:1135 stop:1491 length:357 start_codon:yes stop_codon:yes gene_type:complete
MKLTKIKLAQITKETLELKEKDLKVLPLMFLNIKKNDKHFQLTYNGFKMLKSCGFQHYKIKLAEQPTMKSLLNLDRNSPCPYYINKKKTYVLFFAEQPAILLQLLDGNLKQFEFNSDV